jgi:molecular chaperone GrpE
MTKYRIPVRVVASPAAARRARVLDADLEDEAASNQPTDVSAQVEEEETAVDAVSSVAVPDRADQATQALGDAAEQAFRQAAQSVMPEAVPKPAPAPFETPEGVHSYRSSESADWKERALRLQADMANYRQRQKRIAHEQAQTEQAALLKDLLAVADNLDRALAAGQAGAWGRQDESDPLTQGVEMTRTALQRTLSKYGLELFQVLGEPFDPAWQEAVHVVPANAFGVTPGTVVEVLEDGYRRRGALFRPAKVVVAQ